MNDKRKEKITEHAMRILTECEQAGYSNGEVSLLMNRVEELRKEAVCKSEFHTHSFEDSFYSFFNSSHK